MFRKLWFVAAVTVACVALTPDTAEAGRRRQARKHKGEVQSSAPMLTAPTPQPVPVPTTPATKPAN